MSEVARYAILDTDFVSKANIIRAQGRVLADEVLSFQGYKFFCHQKMKDELGDHGTRAAQGWLDQKIASGEITCYDDSRIIVELLEAVGAHGYFYYQSFLKSGCDLIQSDYYVEYFGKLDEWLEAGHIETDSFLSILSSCEELIGHQKSYGEVKAFVLLKVINLLFSADTVIFCSDDFEARQGFSNFALVPCISILSVFLKLWSIGKPFEEVQPFYHSFVDWCLDRENPQVTVKVWVYRTGSEKREKVPIGDVLRDIYGGKYAARKDGDLQLL